jgi:peptidoglycan/LPS O-acetylase OafA/YrhL
MHLTAFAALASLHPPDWGLGLNWTRMIIFVILFSYAFYLVVEKPGHEIAKRAAQFVKQRTGGKIVPPPQSAPVPGPAASELVK